MADPVAAFAQLARDYCELLECGDSLDSAQFLPACQSRLLALYAGALDLPVGSHDEVKAPEIRHEDWAEIQASISSRIPGHDFYWVACEPTSEQPQKVGGGLLSDDLADVWRDLRSGLQLFDSGLPNGHALAAWEWRFHFEFHWGRHCVDAIAVLHSLRFSS